MDAKMRASAERSGSREAENAERGQRFTQVRAGISQTTPLPKRSKQRRTQNAEWMNSVAFKVGCDLAREQRPHGTTRGFAADVTRAGIIHARPPMYAETFHTSTRSGRTRLILLLWEETNMYVEKTIIWDGNEFVICGTKDYTIAKFMCDGCGNMCDGILTVARERAQEEITFWCADCMDEVRTNRD